MYTVSELNAFLKERLVHLLPATGRLEGAIPGFAISRFDAPVSATRCFYNPMIALVVQGYKRSMIGDHEANYGEQHCVTVGMDMPGVFHITGASPEEPFLSLSVRLDRRCISQLISEVPSLVTDNGAATGAATGAAMDSSEVSPVVVAEAGRDLLQAFARLVVLLDTPERIPVLAPMLLREIHYYLLCGSQGKCLRMFNSGGAQDSQIARAIAWLREHFSEPLRMEDVARSVNMAPSTFNRHFKEVTSLSPLQFQKRLRLYEAERLMLLEGMDAGSAALTVGYESASQFNREYKRLFGAPPRKDVASKRS